MGNASHRFQNARGHLQTRLSPYRVAELAHRQSPPTPTPTLRYERGGPGFLQFSVRGFAGVFNQMTFVVHISSTDYGCEVKTDIQAFTTSQQKVGIIPAGRKALLGYKQYQQFFERLSREVAAEDPTSRATFSGVG
ncbi:hypothetical protein [Gordonia sp. (in: high G+C Gram-positive bacteria)]|uniref:hypothetical protein n=1 Tax=Gordonia sp. (in: high G+C Gram-positive bacteria) TaxID=84139 RepID=UPI0016A7B420|nr:hypothetical protein [Gordonia sp. (in: high G+C Gram-positive bacteria)]NLG47178.1 hypothetical protein [Gordonia sp. (in: high G+C Gram-positive bacteria)]